MNDTAQLVVFCVAGQRQAVPLDVVQRAVAAAEVTPLPGAPAMVLGAIDLGGEIVPVFSLRRRLGVADRALQPSDQFLVARMGERAVALAVDEVQGVRASEDSVIDPTRLAPGLEPFQGVVRLDDGLLLIHDLERFLSPQDQRALAAAMDRVP